MHLFFIALFHLHKFNKNVEKNNNTWNNEETIREWIY
jgi:hypothetical protein